MMTLNDRSDLIIKYFDFLVSKHSFHIAEKEFNPNAMGNAYVIFKSTRIGIEIVVDRNQVLINIGDILDPKHKWFEFSNILRYFASSEIAYDFEEKTSNNTWDEIVEDQLKRLAKMLVVYCAPLLSGDLSMKKEIERIQEARKAELFKKFREVSERSRNNR